MEVGEPKNVAKFPKSVFFVFGNELCERYAYYGMRAVLMLYLTRQIGMEASSSKVLFHSFSTLNYFIPLFGALLADTYLGKFKTILYVSLIYAFGSCFLSLVTIPQLHLDPKVPLVITALVVIAIGSGGIKPCVASFGGDQFVKGQETMREKFFSIFYFCINVGAALSMVLSPIFRAKVSCLGLLECYPLAFGFPALLMVIATVIFVVGKPFYKIIPPNGTAVVDLVRCIWHALIKRKKSEKKEKWLDYADDKYSTAYIEDVRTVLSVLLLFLPLPMFWALFDQQGSTWTLQSAKMDGRMTEDWEIEPDQMDSLNAIIVLAFIPLFTFVVYPLLTKCNLLKTPLQKMCTGGFLTAISFLIGGFIQLAVEARLPTPPIAGTIDIMMINTLNCRTNLNFASKDITLKPYEHFIFHELEMNKQLKAVLTASEDCKNANRTDEIDINLKDGKAYSAAIIQSNENLTLQIVEQVRKRDMKKGYPFVRLLYTEDLPFKNATLRLKQPKSNDFTQQMTFENNTRFTTYASIHPLFDCDICWTESPETEVCSKAPKITGSISVYKGGIYDFLVVTDKNNNNSMRLVEMETSQPDSIHILYQLPMYILITAGEVMVSITGLAFAYSQAPTEMKAVLQAAWLLTVAFGNLIVIIIVELKENFFHSTLESTYFFFFAALMTVDMIIFSIFAYRYKYKTEL